MTAKEYLSQIRRLENRILIIEEQIAEAKESAASAGAHELGMAAGHSMSSRAESAVIRILGKQEELLVKKAALIEQKDRIIEEIGRLDDQRYIDILTMRYARHMKLVDIADEMTYTYPHLCRLHGEALIRFAELYGLNNVIES